MYNKCIIKERSERIKMEACRMNATLIILAAGLGSRFKGGIKQLEPLGPSGEIIMDYSIYDAKQAGFDKVVFIIRKDIREAFDKMIGDRIKKHIAVDYVYQELDRLPEGFECPKDRVKPWGHGHAVWCCKGAVNEPFVVINADDYYGKQAFTELYKKLEQMNREAEPMSIAMAGFRLRNTLSDFGSVNRGVCKVNGEKLTSICETYDISRGGDGLVRSGRDKDTVIDEDSFVSMNMWACPAGFIGKLDKHFNAFLDKNAADIKAEFLLPGAIEEMIESGEITCDVVSSSDQWFGVTYAQDTPIVKARFRELTDKGVYPEDLWG